MRHDISSSWFRKALGWNFNRTAMLALIIMVLSGLSATPIVAQTGCRLFTKSFALDETKFYTGNGLVNVFGDFTAYSKSGKRLVMVKVTLVDAMSKLVCKGCDTTWHPTSALFINGSLTPNPNSPSSPAGTIQNGFRRMGTNAVYEKGSKFSDYSISWGSLDSAKRNPLLNENAFALDMNIQFDSPTDSMYTNLRFSLNYEFTDTDGNRCDTTISYAATTVYVEAPFNSVYREQPVTGVKIKGGNNPSPAMRNLLVLDPLEGSDNKFMMKFAWRKSDMKMNQMVIDNAKLSDPKYYITEAVVVKDNVAVEYTPDTAGKITIPLDDLKLSAWDTNIDTSIFGTFATEFRCEKWTADTPDNLNAAISFQYTPNHVSKKTFSTPFENYRVIRPSKVGDKGLSENTTDPKPKDIKAFMLSFVNDSPTKSEIYSIDFIPTDKKNKIIGGGKIKDDNDTSNGGITARFSNNPNYCISCLISKTDSSNRINYGISPTANYDMSLYRFEPCCKISMYGNTPDVIWKDVQFNTGFIRVTEDYSPNNDPDVKDNSNSLNYLDISVMRPIPLGEKSLPMILFVSNAGSTVPIEFSARDIKGKIVSKGTITLKNIISSIDMNEGATGMVVGVSPNPANEGTTLNFSLENNARSVSVSVCDIQGSVVKSILTQSPLNAGSQAMYFDTSLLANGVYMVKIEVDGKVHTTKLTVAR